MHRDARMLADGAVLEAEVCIVGAGPAGLALARALRSSGRRVVVLETGGLETDEGAQLLNEGAVVGDPYVGLRQTRHRGVGGTACIWNTPVGGEPGAKYLPLDPWDFEPGDDRVPSGWPIGHDQLAPYYRRAQGVCGLGPFTYDAADWTDPRRPVLALAAPLATGVYQFGPARLFTHTYPHELGASDDVHVYDHIVVRELTIVGGAVHAAEASALSGARVSVRADTFVVAAGAIENARLLLLSAAGDGRAPGNAYGQLGRCLMEHPRDRALTLVPSSRSWLADATFYDAHAGPDDTVVCGRIAVDGRATRAAGLPGASLTLLPGHRGLWPSTGIAGRIARRMGVPWIAGPTGGHGWSGRSPRRLRTASVPLLINLEQRPDPDNRVELSADRDALGQPRAIMHWRFRRHERDALDALRRTVAAALDDSGIGEVRIDATATPDPNAHHHAGTTRMHADPRHGVVDADLRVHGVENLYAAGASVFPTAGFANPTLTIVALSLRLADHLGGAGHASTDGGQRP
jgi:choline dehydrogenase-like flavoprotein